MSDFQLHPVAATAHAAQVDTLFYCMLALTGTVALALAFLITFFSASNIAKAPTRAVIIRPRRTARWN